MSTARLCGLARGIRCRYYTDCYRLYHTSLLFLNKRHFHCFAVRPPLKQVRETFTERVTYTLTPSQLLLTSTLPSLSYHYNLCPRMSSQSASPLHSVYHTVDGGVCLHVYAQPGAKSTQMDGKYDDDSVKIRVASPPVDGKANKELCTYLAKLCGVSKSKVRVIKGDKSRQKYIQVDCEEATLLAVLEKEL